MNTKSRCGYFLFSLDTELAWGHFDQFHPDSFSADGERRTIKKILEVLDEYNIAATWAVVGGMIEDCFKESRIAKTVPDWPEKYPLLWSYIKNDSRLFFGPDILNMIQKYDDRHEIACHGYTHRLFLEGLLSRETARAEIEAWINIASKRGIQGFSFTFPRNKVGYLPIFKEYGFKCYRGVTVNPTFFSLPLFGRGFRRFEYFWQAFVGPCTYPLPKIENGLINLPSSQWFFGLNRWVEDGLDRLRLPYARLAALERGIHKAASRGEVIHIFAHPYEFRNEMDFQKLRHTLEVTAHLIQQGKLQSLSMAGLAKKIFMGLDEH